MTMTESVASAPAEPSRYIQIWLDSLAQVLGQTSGSPLPCVTLPEAPSDPPPATPGDLWVVGTCSGGLRGEMSLRLPAAATLRLAQTFLSTSEPPAEAELTSGHRKDDRPETDSRETDPPETDSPATDREMALKLLRHVAGLVAGGLKAIWGEVQLRLEGAPGAPSWPASSTTWIRAGEDPANPVAMLEMQLSAALVAGLRAEKPEAAKPPAPSAVPVPSSPEENQAKLALLMEVELAVTLRFGSRRLLLREVLELNPGAVVELDRQVEEPVDLLVDGRLVARGQVVVMDGDYGIRVTEVAASP
jgi:flagellar motor switch protein FliN